MPAIKLASATNPDDDHVDLRQPGACGAGDRCAFGAAQSRGPGTNRGLLTSTLLTLVFVRAIYAICDDMEDSLGD